MSQLDLFRAERELPGRTEPDVDFIRKELNNLLIRMREAKVMPWPPHREKSWEARFPRLAAMLPGDEAQRLTEEFSRHLSRLRAA